MRQGMGPRWDSPSRDGGGARREAVAPTVGTAAGRPGAAVRGALRLAEAADGTALSAPVIVVGGALPGPTLWIDGALHGDELDGVAAIWALIDAVDPGALAGNLVCVPGMNPGAFRAMRRASPVDDTDVNRVFPGRADGPHTQQLAAAYVSAVSGVADAYVNLHGGRKTSDVMFYAIYRDTGPGADRARAMAHAVGASTVWRSRDRWLDTSLFDWLTREGVPSIIIEVGGEGRIRPEHTGWLCQGLTGVMRCLGMLPGGAPPAEPSVTVQEADFFFCASGGVWESGHRAGDRVRRGDAIGTVRDVYGDVRDVVRCQAEEGILLSLRTYAAAPAGSTLGIVGVLR